MDGGLPADFSLSMTIPLLVRRLFLNGLLLPAGPAIFSFIWKSIKEIKDMITRYTLNSFKENVWEWNSLVWVYGRHPCPECDRKQLARKDPNRGSVSIYRGAKSWLEILRTLGCLPVQCCKKINEYLKRVSIGYFHHQVLVCRHFFIKTFHRHFSATKQLNKKMQK